MKTLLLLLLAISTPAFAVDSIYGGGGSGSGSTAFADITGSATDNASLSTALSARVADTGDETVAGVKTFSSNPILSANTASRMLVSGTSKEVISTPFTYDLTNNVLAIPLTTNGTQNILQIGTNTGTWIANELGEATRIRYNAPSGGRHAWYFANVNSIEHTLARTLFMDQSGVNAHTVDLQPGKNAANVARACGIIHSNFTDVGNVGAGTDTLMTYTRPTNYLAVDGSFIRWTVVFDLAANANSKQITCTSEDGTTVFDSTAQTANDGIVRGEFIIQRTGSASTDISGVWSSSNSAYTGAPIYTTGSDTLSGTAVMACQAVGVDDNDVVQKQSIMEWCPGI